MTGSTGVEDSRGREDRHPRSRAPGWLVMTALAVGLGAGLGIGTGARTSTGDAAAARDAPAVTASADTPAPTPPAASRAVPRLSDTCLRAIEAAERTHDAIEDLGNALLALDARRLDEIVHRLEPLRDQLARGAAACQADLEAAPATGGASPAPSPAAGATPAPVT